MRSDTERDCARRDVQWLRQLIDRGDWGVLVRWAPAIAGRYTATEERSTYHHLDAARCRSVRAVLRMRYEHQVADDVYDLVGSQDPTHWRWSPAWDRIGDMCLRLAVLDRADRLDRE